MQGLSKGLMVVGGLDGVERLREWGRCGGYLCKVLRSFVTGFDSGMIRVSDEKKCLVYSRHIFTNISKPHCMVSLYMLLAASLITLITPHFDTSFENVQ